MASQQRAPGPVSGSAVQRTVAKGIEERLDQLSYVVEPPVGRGWRGVAVGDGLDEAVVASRAVDVDDVAREPVHSGNERLPVSRLEHVGHAGKRRAARCAFAQRRGRSRRRGLASGVRSGSAQRRIEMVEADRGPWRRRGRGKAGRRRGDCRARGRREGEGRVAAAGPGGGGRGGRRGRRRGRQLEEKWLQIARERGDAPARRDGALCILYSFFEAS